MQLQDLNAKPLHVFREDYGTAFHNVMISNVKINLTHFRSER